MSKITKNEEQVLKNISKTGVKILNLAMKKVKEIKKEINNGQSI